MASSQILSFQPLSSHISPTFWHALTKLKIDVLKLSSDNVPIQGNFDWGKWVWDKNADAGKGKEVGLGGGCALEIDQDAFVVAGQERQQ
jgi:ubiquitin-like modifier-activating enzyme ATG7